MCLWRITKTYRKPKDTIVRAYKIVMKDGQQWVTIFRDHPVPTGAWLTAEEQPYLLSTEDRRNGRRGYRSGFHVYRTRKGQGRP